MTENLLSPAKIDESDKSTHIQTGLLLDVQSEGYSFDMMGQL